MKPSSRLPGLIAICAGVVCFMKPAPAQTVLVEAGSEWSYLHEGRPAPNGWNELKFELDWMTGPAKFGFGSDGEVTVLPDNGTLTTYFRHVLFVEAPDQFTNLMGRIVADDGAVVYMNGVEISRINMPPGPLSYTTPAGGDIGGSGETNWVNFVPLASPLVEGPNVIAVEVHQASPFSRDLGFDLELLANVPNLRPSLAIDSPLPGNSYEAGTNVLVRAVITDVGNQVSNIVFRIDDEVRWSTAPAVPEFIWADVPPGPHTLTVGTVLLDGTTIESEPVDVMVQPPPGFAVLLPNGAIWNYLDDGTDPGPGWSGLTYDDSAWSRGPAELGYGDDGNERRPERTVVRYGPNLGNRYVTTYFRRAFMAQNPDPLGSLLVRLLRDDGAVVYLNGVEVARSNMPIGPINPGTLAINNALDDGTVFHDFPAPVELLRAGLNVVAVEVHQSSPESSDLSFDLMLLARPTPPEFFLQPASVIVPYCIDVTLHAEATGSPEYQWLRNGLPIPAGVGPILTLASVERDAAGLYTAIALNEGGTAVSETAEVQVCLTKQGGVMPGVIATTNLNALFALEAAMIGGGGGFGPAAAAAPQVQLSHGVPLYFNTGNGSSNALVPVICGVPASHTKWVGYFSRIGQRLRISTEGSDFDTVLGVYTNSGGLNPKLAEVACDRGTAAEPAGIVEFDAERRFYYIAVDGENGGTGTVRLKIGLGVLQAPSHEPATDTFHFEVAVRSNILSFVRSTTSAALPGLTNFASWTPHGQFITNRDWVFPQSVSNVSTFPLRHFGGREQ